MNKIHNITFETMWVEIKSSMAAELLLSVVMLHFTSITKCWYFMANACLMLALTLLKLIVLFKTLSEKKPRRRYNRVVGGSACAMVLCLVFLVLTLAMFVSSDMVIGHKKAMFIAMLAIVQVGLGISDVLFTGRRSQMQIVTYRYLSLSYIFAGAALSTNAILQVFVTEEAAVFQGMTGLCFAAIASVFSCVVWSRNVMRREENRQRWEKLYENRLYLFTWISGKKDIVMVIIKVILGILTASGFMFANALYSGGMGIARHIALKDKDSDYKQQIRGMKKVGYTIMWASICYVIYSVRLLIYESSPQYPLVMAIAIAAYTFFEFGWTWKDFKKTRDEHNIFAHEIKGIGLASILICFVLTQTALMSTAYEGNASFYNGLSGILFGGLAVLVGVYLVVYASHLRRSAV